DAALDAFCANDDPERLRLLAVYGAANLRRMLIGVYETLRAAGRGLVLELGDRPSLEMRCKEWVEAARCLSADTGSSATHRETALDFEDLQLRARDLLRDHESIRAREQLRFRSIMVDEFQDTNRLQCELIDFLAGGPEKEVFFVGDEFQSIYGFRHADVHVFRERR